MKKLLSSMLALAGLCSLALPAQSQDLKGDAAAGRAKADMCIGCHGISGYKASFPQIYHVPAIGGQNEKYLVAAMHEYKSGARKFASMHAVVAPLSDQDIANIATYYAGLGKDQPVPEKLQKEPPAAVAALLTKGNCASCHGANFNTPIDPSYPKLAGQYADYLYASLKAYQTQNNAVVGRSNPIMMGMAAPFSHAELQTIANFLSTLPGSIKTPVQPGFR